MKTKVHSCNILMNSIYLGPCQTLPKEGCMTYTVKKSIRFIIHLFLSHSFIHLCLDYLKHFKNWAAPKALSKAKRKEGIVRKQLIFFPSAVTAFILPYLRVTLVGGQFWDGQQKSISVWITTHRGLDLPRNRWCSFLNLFIYLYSRWRKQAK